MADRTQGPWIFNSPIKKRFSGEDWAMQIEADACMIGEAYWDDESAEECAGNARLMAAAPDLLETASSVLDWYDLDGSVGGAADVIESLRQAVQKAAPNEGA